MRLLISAMLAVPTMGFADELRVPHSRVTQIRCYDDGTLITTVSGNTTDLSISRRTESEVRYEIYKSGYVVATCDNIAVD
ncbi:MAG TPA: hypothetical protein PKC28_15180 [Bdellovibrionales bacterium]|nr:hypothetical protein [Bdellovibrionales bacterium]